MDQFFTWLWSVLDLPALLLVAIMVLMFYVLYRIQQNPDNDFDFSDMFRDETGKPSAARIMVLVCGGVTSWVLMYMIIHDDGHRVDPIFFGLYLGAWSGTALASKWMDLSKMNAQVNLRADYHADLSDSKRSRSRDEDRDTEDDDRGGMDTRGDDRPATRDRDRDRDKDADPRAAERKAAERRAAEREAAEAEKNKDTRTKE